MRYVYIIDSNDSQSADNARSPLPAISCRRWLALRFRCCHTPECPQDHFRLAARHPRRILYWGIGSANAAAEGHGAIIGICLPLLSRSAGLDHHPLTPEWFGAAGDSVDAVDVQTPESQETDPIDIAVGVLIEEVSHFLALLY